VVTSRFSKGLLKNSRFTGIKLFFAARENAAHADKGQERSASWRSPTTTDDEPNKERHSLAPARLGRIVAVWYQRHAALALPVRRRSSTLRKSMALLLVSDDFRDSTAHTKVEHLLGLSSVAKHLVEEI
jgi:hypothetical protein